MKDENQKLALPPSGQWPHGPVLLYKPPKMPCGNTLRIETHCSEPPIGTPFEFESPLFKGQILLRVRNLEDSDDKNGDAAYFDGRKRLFQVVVQGKFKKQMKTSDVIFGSEYSKPLKMKPPAFMMRPIQSFLKKKCPGIELDLISDSPKVLSIFLGSVQTVRVDEPGLEPDITSIDIEEKNVLFGSHFATDNKPVSAAKRKKLFSNPKFASQYQFDTEHVYTFDHFDDIMNISRFELKLSSIFHCDLARIVDDPFQCLAKSKTGEGYLWYFEVWHEKLVRNLGAPCEV